MKEYRSGSQILFGFLPEQTVDLNGRVWKVREWREPKTIPLDDTTLRQELIRQAGSWSAKASDSGYLQYLMQARPIRVITLDKDNGVKVEQFPNVFVCQAPNCRRVPKPDRASCKCGAKRFGQLPFVGYHDKCGALVEPWIPRCKTHDDVRVVLPGTSSASEIRFECPSCHKLLRTGFGFPPCQCGDGKISHNVHRAASVYTPRTVVIVNPLSPEKVRRLTAAGGGARALSWVLDGLSAERVEDIGATRESLLAQLLDSGIARDVAERMVRQAEEAGQFRAHEEIPLPEDRRAAAEQESTTIALALSESRVRVARLVGGADPGSHRHSMYSLEYPRAISSAGLEAVELIEKFPVLTGNFGYTRGSSKPGDSRLIPFRNQRGEALVYSEVGNTEALFVRLDPKRVAEWLRGRGHPVASFSDPRSARISILQSTAPPNQVGDSTANDAGRDLLTLVHSYSHRFMRFAATHAGIERNSLSELIVPRHLGFFIYAAARGDFVLGGLQAVFETELDRLLLEVSGGALSCPLDPGCQRAGGACMACLHVGEPSCRYFNMFLDRSTLTGASGFLSP